MFSRHPKLSIDENSMLEQPANKAQRPAIVRMVVMLRGRKPRHLVHVDK